MSLKTCHPFLLLLSKVSQSSLKKVATALLIIIFSICIRQYAIAQTWRPIGPNDDNWPSYYGLSDLAFDANDIPYIITQDAAGKAVVRKYNGGKWTNVGEPGFSEGAMAFGSIAINGGGTPYVVYKDIVNGNKATVKKYDGSNWVDVGLPGFSAGIANCTVIAIDDDDNPYVAYSEGNLTGHPVVKKFNGHIWIDVGVLGAAAGDGYMPSLVIDHNNVPYVAYWRPPSPAGSGPVTIKKYDGLNWITLGVDIQSVGKGGFSMAIGHDNTLYIAHCGSWAYAKKYNGSAWTDIGAQPISTGGIGRIAITVDPNGIPYIQYQVVATGDILSKKYDGVSWVNVGQVIRESMRAATHMTIRANSNGVVYNTANASDSSTYLMGLKKLNGTNWEDVGTTGFSTERPESSSFALNSAGLPYVIYADRSDSLRPKIKKYEGNNWINVGTQNFSAINFSGTIKINKNDVPYVGYSDRNFNSRATVKKFDGIGYWLTVGNPGFSSGNSVHSTSLAFDKPGDPYLSYIDIPVATSGFVSTKKLSGNDWINVGASPLSVLDASFPSIVFDRGGIPYVIYQDGINNYKAVVKKYDGSGWVNVGPAGISAGKAAYTFLSFDTSSTPFIIYQDENNYNKATVKKYDGSNWIDVGTPGISEGIASLCSIKFDGANDLYIAYRDGGINNRAVIKKYDGANWVAVGDVASVGPTNYLSLELTPSGIPVIVYSNIFAFAKAFIPPLNLGPLKAEKTPETSVKMKWSTYDERGISYFDIQYSADNTNFVSVGRVNAKSSMGILTDSNNYQFTHPAPKKGNNYYRVNAVGLYGYEKLSNPALVNFDATGFLAMVFPNPLTDQSVLSVFANQQSTLDVRVTDVARKLLWEVKNVSLNPGSNRLNVPLANCPHGIYLLEAVLSSGERQTIKLIK